MLWYRHLPAGAKTCVNVKCGFFVQHKCVGEIKLVMYNIKILAGTDKMKITLKL